jgi:eukaryotic-like serine/threonine-protein kinase
MGVVYEGRDLRTEARVAVKVLDQPRGLRTKQTTVRFRREAKTAMAIASPHVTRVLDHSADGDMLYLVMEYLEGEDLQQVFTQADPLPPAIALRIAAQACTGLVSAHAHGIMHRDIKPANLFLAREGDGIIVKLVDFGIAKIWKEELRTKDATSVTHTGSLVGSPAYMSPEQARGTRRIDARTDLWSLGVVLYRALSGLTPHQGMEGLGELIMAICSDPPPPLRVVAPWVSADVDALVSRALQIDPAARFSTATAMLEAITRLVPDGTALHPSQIVPWEVTDEMKAKAKEPSSTVESTTTGRQRVVIRPPSTPDTESLSMTETVDSSPRGSRDVAGQLPIPAPGPAVVLSPSPPTGPAKKGLRARVFWLSAALGVAALAIAGAFAMSRTPANVRSVEPMVSSSAAPPVTAQTGQAIVDLPDPKGCNAASTGEYQAGLKSLRGGQWDVAHRHFERAADVDPTCAEAHLRLLLTGRSRYSRSKLLAVYQKAVDLGSRLTTDRDRSYLDAFKPVVQFDPPDKKEFVVRLMRLADQFPTDAEFAFMVSYSTDFGPADLPSKIQKARKAVELDPEYADAWWALGDALDRSGSSHDALEALDGCLRAVPTSADCSDARVTLLLGGGQCKEALAAMRTRPSIALDSANSYLNLASALIVTGSPPETVNDALDQREALLTPDERWWRERYDRAIVSVLRGDFNDAANRLREVLGKIKQDPDRSLRSARVLLEILLETSQQEAAGALADDWFKRTPSLQSNPNRAVITEAQLHLAPLLLSAGRQTDRRWARDWRVLRDRWLKASEGSEKLSKSEAWTLGSALLTQTGAEAVEALAKVPSSVLTAGDNERSPLTRAESFLVGRTLLFAGRVDEALPFLSIAVAACDVMAYPFWLTRAHLSMGQALEQKGNKAGACEAYAVILQRWGHASPPSITATEARASASALGCSR